MDANSQTESNQLNTDLQSIANRPVAGSPPGSPGTAHSGSDRLGVGDPTVATGTASEGTQGGTSGLGEDAGAAGADSSEIGIVTSAVSDERESGG